MRICVGATSFPARKTDHRGVFVRELCQGLATEGHEVRVVVPHPGAGAPIQEIEGNLTVHRVGYAPKNSSTLFGAHGVVETLRDSPLAGWQLPGSALALAQGLWRHSVGCQWILSHWILPTGVLAAQVAALRSIPHGIIEHGGAARIFRRMPAPLAGSLLDSGRTDAIQFVSSGLRSMVLGSLPSGRISDWERISFVFPVPLLPDTHLNNPQETEERVLFVGRLIPSKGVSVLLSALEDLTDVSLTVVGDGPHRRDLESQAARLGLTGRIRFRGELPPQSVRSLMGNHSIVVVPSLDSSDGQSQEGTPRILLEAMRAGSCIVASRTGGIQEALKHQSNGWLVKPGSVDELRGALRTLIGLPSLCDELGRRAAEDVQRFTFDRWLEQWDQRLRFLKRIDRASS